MSRQFDRTFVSALLLISAAGLLHAELPSAINAGWAPVTDAERQMASPIVEKDAGVEALFWRVHVADNIASGELQRVLYHYVRLKVFTDKGKERAATLDIPYGEKTSVLNISGRTIKADGTIIELKKDAIHERDLVRAGRLRRRVKSFAMPGVEPGAIVEYKWQELRTDRNILYMRLQMQREFPVQKVTYYVKPLPPDYSAGYRMAVWPFNCKPTPLKLEDNDFNSTILEKVPAFKEEAMMPAEPNVRPWLLVFYHNKGKREPQSYWEDVGKEIYKELKQTVKLSSDVKQATEKALENTKESEKVTVLIRYIRKNTRGLFNEDVSEAERMKVIKSMPRDRRRNSAEVLESGIGTPDELNTLFAAMATHAGLDARPVLIADRNDVLFNPQMAERYFLRNVDIAVKQGEQWNVFDVSARLLAPGMLSWQESGMPVLLSDPKKPAFIQAPASPPEASLALRTGKLSLSADGTLTGMLEERYTGHSAYDRRLEFAGNAEAKNEERIKDLVTRVFPKAEVSGIKVENAEDPEKPFIIRFAITAPQYAQRTGKRIFFQPALFQRGDAPMFEATERQHDIHFRYPWKETDEVSIDLPEGYQLDAAESPGEVNFGPPGTYSLNLLLKNGRTLICQRSLVFGANDAVMYPRSAYPALKKAFDEIHRRDNHTISLKQASISPGQ